VIDGAIQGDAIRLVLAPYAEADTVAAAVAGSEVRVAPTPPRFEDAFIDMLGGGPGGRSKLAEAASSRPTDEAKPVIVARGLTKRFGDFTAAENISFEISRTAPP
jgi:ABC-2 type transport system ATP-binding protein